MKKKFSLIFIASIILLAFSSVLSALMLYEYDYKKFLLAIIPAAVLAGIVLTEIILADKNILKFIAKLNSAVGSAENEILYYDDTPSVIIDESFRILWCNKEFNVQFFEDHEIFASDISDYLEIDLKSLMLDGATSVEFNGRSFKSA